MSSHRAFDPLTGKPMGIGTYKPRPELAKRLAEEVQRKTSEGTFKTKPDGRVDFVPKGIMGLQNIAEPAAAFVRGAMVRVAGCIDALCKQDPWPMTRELANEVAGVIGMVAGPTEDGTGYYVEASGNCVLMLAENLRALTPAELLEALPPTDAQPALTHNQQVLARMRAIKTEPVGFQDGERVRIRAKVTELMERLEISTMDAGYYMGREGQIIGDPFHGQYCVRFVNEGGNKVSLLHLPPEFLRRAEQAEGADEHETLGLTSCEEAASRNGALLRLATDGLPLQESYAVLGMTQAELAQVVGYPEALDREYQQAFDPMREPLALGDYVEVVFREPSDAAVFCCRFGQRGHIAKYHRNGNPLLRYDDGTEDEFGGWSRRESLKLLRKAARPENAYTCELGQNDLVEVVSGDFAGKQGHVLYTQHGAPMVQLAAAMAIKFARVNVRLVARALPL